MLIVGSLMILTVLVLFSFILGTDFIQQVAQIGVDSEAIVNGSLTTYVVETQSVLFQVDTTQLIIAGIAILVSISIVAGITGIQVLGSGLNPESAKIIILITAFIGVWSALSILAFNLIYSIQVFGSVIYIGITLAYTIGVVQKISGGSE